jgi:hypothetical protein
MSSSSQAQSRWAGPLTKAWEYLYARASDRNASRNCCHSSPCALSWRKLCAESIFGRPAVQRYELQTIKLPDRSAVCANMHSPVTCAALSEPGKMGRVP